jgi:hypothetical protein
MPVYLVTAWHLSWHDLTIFACSLDRKGRDQTLIFRRRAAGTCPAAHLIRGVHTLSYSVLTSRKCEYGSAEGTLFAQRKQKWMRHCEHII